MKAYPLYPFEKGGNFLRPGNSSGTDEYVRKSNELSLIEYLVDEGYGRTSRRYRLCTRTPMSFSDSLEYDIACPRCGSHLRVCGNQIDSNTHALYKCRCCDNERRKF